MEHIPRFALGTWKSPNDQVVTDSVRYAIEEAGYRHIDCARVYGNEANVGKALHDVLSRNVVKREEIWVTSKLWNTDHHPEHVEEACRQTLKDLQLEYLDLYLIHWPVSFQHGGECFPKDEDGNFLFDNTVKIHDTWKALEQLVEKGLVRHIGVSNFTIELLEKVLHFEDLKIKPYADQVECHLYLQQQALREFCKKHGIIVEGYSTLGTADSARPVDPVLLKDEVLNEVASECGKTAAQVELQFLYQLDPNLIVIAKSVTPSRIKENNERTFELTGEQIEKLKARNRCYRYCDAHIFWKTTVFGDHW